MPGRFHAIGDLRERVAIQEEGIADDSGGGGPLTWTAVATVWGKVWPISGREIELANGQASMVSTLIVVRYRSDVAAGMRCVVNGKAYNIRTVVDPQSRREWIEMLCEAGAPT